MSFYIVMGLVAILIVMFESLWFVLRNEIVQSHMAMKAEIVNHLCEAAAEEVVMGIRREMNRHKGMQTGNFYALFRAGAEDGGMSAPAVDCPATREMAKKYYGIKDDKIEVAAAFINKRGFDTDMMGDKRKVASNNKGCSGTLRVTAKVEYDGYARKLEIRKDIKVARVVPPYPDFALVVRDGGHVGANYNQWAASHGAEKLNLVVLAGDKPDASKNGKILFGGGLDETSLVNLIPDPYPKTLPFLSAWMSGWIPPPTPEQLRTMGLKQWPIVVNLTNYGVNNLEVGTLYDSTVQNIPEFAGMTPTSDFHAYGTEKENLGEFVSAVPTQRVPYEIPVVRPKPGSGPAPPPDGAPPAPDGAPPEGGGETETSEVEMTFFRATLGMGEEIAKMPEKAKPYGLHDKKAEGFKNYFGRYAKVYAGSPFDPTGSGLDLIGSDPTDESDHVKRPHRNTLIYGNVISSYLTAHVVKIEKGDAKAAALPWVDLSAKMGIDEMQVLLDPPYAGKLPKEYMHKASIGNLVGAAFNKMKKLFGGGQGSEKINYPHCGKEESDKFEVPVPEALLEPWRGDGLDTIHYRKFMSSAKFFPADPQMFGVSQTPGTQYTGKMLFRRDYVSPVTGQTYDAAKFNEIIPSDLFDLSPDMASYKFVGPMEFIMYLQNNGMLVQDPRTGWWDLYLDGIWFVQGLVSDSRYQTLTIPPPSFQGQPAGAMRVHGKGMIATVEGTDITVGGIVEAGDEGATQLSLCVAPTRVLFNLQKLREQNPDLIPMGMSLSGNIILTDQPAQVSLCSPLGELHFQDDPTWDQKRAEATYRKGALFDRFYVIGNVVVHRLDQSKLKQQRKSDNIEIGGGVIRYDPMLIQDAFGQEDVRNYHVSMGQRNSYFNWETVHDKDKSEGPTRLE